MGVGRALTWLVVAWWLSGCGSESVPVAVAGCGDPLAMQLDDGSCSRPGIAPGECAAGFVHDGAYGCLPLLPPDRCAPGLTAVPGDSLCRPVMDCGAGPWPLELPSDAPIHHVDAAYAGASDGSEAQPWTTISDAVSAAASGDVIAIAAGNYAEGVEIAGKAVTLWGRCPELVTVASSAPTDTCPIAAVCVSGDAASGSIVRGLRLTGGNHGFAISGAQDVLVDRVWVHDTGYWGVFATWQLGSPSFTLRDSLVEAGGDIGIFMSETVATIERSVVRGSKPSPVSQTFGRGINIQPPCEGGVCEHAARSVVSVSTSVIEDNHDFGVFVFSSDFTMEASVIRGTLPDAASGLSGRGLALQSGCGDATPQTCLDQHPSFARIDGSVLQDNHEIALYVSASELELHRSVVRDTQSASESGRGVVVQPHCTGEFGGPICHANTAARAAIVHSLIEDNRDVGLVTMASSANLDGAVIQRTAPITELGTFGHGIVGYSEFGRAAVTTTRSLIVDNALAGMASFGADLDLGDTHVRCSGAFDLTSQTWEDEAPQWTDRGGNRCGCPDAIDECKISAVTLEPPSAY